MKPSMSLRTHGKIYAQASNGLNSNLQEDIVEVPITLTEVEVATRNSLQIWAPLADGHAAQYDEAWWKKTEADMSLIEAKASGKSDRYVEERYFRAFMALYSQHCATTAQNFKVLPNASMSIEVVMALCRRRRWKVQLLEPCFDNLFLYLKEKDLSYCALEEDKLRLLGAEAINTGDVDLVMLVIPNNPTGFTVPATMFREIAEKCARYRVTLAIDASFRAYDLDRVDHFSILKEAGCSWIVIEDTGKVWPTKERKASILSCSQDLKRDVNEICEIHVLGWSPPILVMLTHLAKTFSKIGLENAILNRVRQTRAIVREAVSGTILRPAPGTENNTLPVEWLEIVDDRYDDLDVAAQLRKSGVGVLPGRHFFFARAEEGKPVTRFIRVSLLKEQKIIERAVKVLRKSILQIK